MDFLLISAPVANFGQATSGLSVLTSYLRAQGWDAQQWDLAIDAFHHFHSPDYLRERLEVFEWMCFQVGHIGPMLGQKNHFAEYASEWVRTYTGPDEDRRYSGPEALTVTVTRAAASAPVMKEFSPTYELASENGCAICETAEGELDVAAPATTEG